MLALCNESRADDDDHDAQGRHILGGIRNIMDTCMHILVYIINMSKVRLCKTYRSDNCSKCAYHIMDVAAFGLTDNQTRHTTTPTTNTRT